MCQMNVLPIHKALKYTSNPCYEEAALNYRGNVNITVPGKTCVEWDIFNLPKGTIPNTSSQLLSQSTKLH